MAKPRVFVSSTFYDLNEIRASLGQFIESLGYDPVLSEHGHVPYDPAKALDESCYDAVSDVDLFVLIIGARYGSTASTDDGDAAKAQAHYTSITRAEYRRALDHNIPCYILVKKAVYNGLTFYRKNKDLKGVEFPDVQSPEVYAFIEEVDAQRKGNPIYAFDRAEEIKDWLRIQWAGLVRDLLRNRTQQTQLQSIATQVASLEAANETLKAYLEKVLSESPATSKDAANVIKNAREKEESSVVKKALARNTCYRVLSNAGLIDNVDEFENLVSRAFSYADFRANFRFAAPPDIEERIVADAQSARTRLGLASYPDIVE